MEQCFCRVGLTGMLQRACWFYLLLGLLFLVPPLPAEAKTRRILLDTDVDTDDIFALLYLLKQNRSLIDLQVCPCSSSQPWSLPLLVLSLLLLFSRRGLP